MCDVADPSDCDKLSAALVSIGAPIPSLFLRRLRVLTLGV
jgi:hypothetical protein